MHSAVPTAFRREYCEFLFALFYHACNAVLGLKLFFFEKFKLGRCVAGADEDDHCGGNDAEHNAKSDTGRGVLAYAEIRGLARACKDDQNDRRDDAQKRCKGYPRRGCLAQRQII